MVVEVTHCLAQNGSKNGVPKWGFFLKIILWVPHRIFGQKGPVEGKKGGYCSLGSLDVGGGFTHRGPIWAQGPCRANVTRGSLPPGLAREGLVEAMFGFVIRSVWFPLVFFFLSFFSVLAQLGQ